MSQEFQPQQIEQLVTVLNKEFGTSISAEQLKAHNYSVSSLRDKLSVMISDSLADDWTTERALELLKTQLGKLLNTSTDNWNEESALNELLPPVGRRRVIHQLDAMLGEKSDILRPNQLLNGILVVLFFACIPLAIGMDWFFSGIAMVVIGVLLFILNKTANNFKVQTLGQWAERMAWRRNLSAKKAVSHQDTRVVTEKVQKVLDGLTF